MRVFKKKFICSNRRRKGFRFSFQMDIVFLMFLSFQFFFKVINANVNLKIHEDKFTLPAKILSVQTKGSSVQDENIKVETLGVKFKTIQPSILSLVTNKSIPINKIYTTRISNSKKRDLSTTRKITLNQDLPQNTKLFHTTKYQEIKFDVLTLLYPATLLVTKMVEKTKDLDVYEEVFRSSLTLKFK